jgi:hypothetical protein
VSIRNRLNRLERSQPDRGRCAACRARPDHVILSARQDSLDASPVRMREQDEVGEPCAACGRAPHVTEVVEILVGARDDIHRLEEAAEARGWRLPWTENRTAPWVSATD